MNRFTIVINQSIRWLILWILGSSLTLSVHSIRNARADDAPTSALTGTITLKDGKMTARIRSAPLADVLREISNLSGAKVRWIDEPGKDVISLRFNDLEFPEAITRILRNYDFLLYYPSDEENSRLAEITIYHGGQAGGQIVTTKEGEMPQSHAEIDSVAEPPAVEQDITQLIDIALNDSNRYNRLNATVELAGLAGEHSEIGEILHQIAERDVDQQVRDSAKEVIENLQEK